MLYFVPSSSSFSTCQKSKTVSEMSESFESLGLEAAALLGHEVEILWNNDEGDDIGTYYHGEIREFNVQTGEHLVVYDDGDRDWYDLTRVKYRIPEKEKERIKEENARLALARRNLYGGIKRGTRKSFFSDSLPETKDVATVGEKNKHSLDKASVVKSSKLGQELKNDAISSARTQLASSPSSFLETKIYSSNTEKAKSKLSKREVQRVARAQQATKASVLNSESRLKEDLAYAKAKTKRLEEELSSALHDSEKKFAKFEIEEMKYKVSISKLHEKSILWTSRSILEERRLLAKIHASEDSIGGVRALRIVFEAMLRERYSQSDESRRREYWDIVRRGEGNDTFQMPSDIELFSNDDFDHTSKAYLKSLDERNRRSKNQRLKNDLSYQVRKNDFFNSEVKARDQLISRFKELKEQQEEIDIADGIFSSPVKSMSLPVREKANSEPDSVSLNPIQQPLSEKEDILNLNLTGYRVSSADIDVALDEIYSPLTSVLCDKRAFHITASNDEIVICGEQEGPLGGMSDLTGRNTMQVNEEKKVKVTPKSGAELRTAFIEGKRKNLLQIDSRILQILYNEWFNFKMDSLLWKDLPLPAIIYITIIFFFRPLVSCVSQYCLSLVLGISVDRVHLQYLSNNIVYYNQHVSLGNELGMLCIGPIMLFLLFILAFTFVSTSCFHNEGVPRGFCSHVIFSLGVAALLDIPLTIILDSLLGNHSCVAKCKNIAYWQCTCQEGTFHRFVSRFTREDHSGFAIFLIILFFVVWTPIVGHALVIYLISFHNAGLVHRMYLQTFSFDKRN